VANLHTGPWDEQRGEDERSCGALHTCNRTAFLGPKQPRVGTLYLAPIFFHQYHTTQAKDCRNFNANCHLTADGIPTYSKKVPD